MPAHAPASWLPDPFGRFELRYWDGATWTHHVASAGRQQVDPPVATPARPDPGGTPAGWHRDPSGRHELRYWDNQWTAHVSTHGKQAYDPLPGQSVAPQRTVATPSPVPTEPVSHTRSAVAQTPAQYVEPVPTQTVRANKKVERQVRRVGADRSQAGGGTLLTEDVLVVNQKAKLIGSTLAYDVYDQRGRQLGAFQEVRRDLATKVSDKMRGRGDSNRTFRFQVVDMQGNVLLAMTRPEQWFSARTSMAIEGPDGIPLGYIIQETTGLRDVVAGLALGGRARRLASATDGAKKIGHTRFGLEAGGRRLGSLYATSWNAWDFAVLDDAGVDIGKVTKTWAGWTKERFTKADNYVVQMKQSVDDPLRSLVVAAALAIDVALKQGPQTRGSSFSGTRTYR